MPTLTLAFLAELSGWWQALDLPAQIFIGIGGLAGAITLLLLAFTVIGLDADGLEAFEAPVDGAHGDGSLISLRSLTAFFLGFGWAGYLVYKNTGNVLAASAGGIVTGAVLMVIIYRIAKKMLRLQSDGTVDFNQAIGSTGTVYITVPAKRGAGGQAQVTFRNRHEVINAVSDSAEPLASGANIRVKERLADNLFLVEPV